MKKNIITKVILLSSFLVIGLLLSCKKEQTITIEPVPPSDNPSFLVGRWIEKEPQNFLQFEGTNHIIEFTNNQSFLELYYWTDIISVGDGADCLNDQLVYFKGGGAEIMEDSIKFFGKATDENFNYIVSECDRYAVFEEVYKYKIKNDSVLILNPNKEIYEQIRLERQ